MSREEDRLIEILEEYDKVREEAFGSNNLDKLFNVLAKFVSVARTVKILREKDYT